VFATLLMAGALLAGSAHAGRADVAGYLRVGARPDFGQGGDGRLGYWNLYGRLLNEGNYAGIEFKYDVLEREALTQDPWTSLHLRVEGGALEGGEPNNGSLSGLRMSQIYVRAGNVLLPDVTWQVGSLNHYFGDLGLYDIRIGEIFYGTLGASARYENDRVDLVLGLGDSGYRLKGDRYNTVITPGGTLRLKLVDGLELGVGGEYRMEPKVQGDANAPHITPGVTYEDWIRGEVVENFLAQNPNQSFDFPFPVPTSASSWKGVGYLGFGGFGPVIWNSFAVSYERKHPDTWTTETYNGEEQTIYVSSLTDERNVLTLGNELQLKIWPNHLDMALGTLYGNHTDGDNDIAPSDHDRTYMSAVMRLQFYITDTVHWLGEGSAAQEVSRNGNTYREHADSIFSNTLGVPDSRGLENGDTDTRHTLQGKTGFVLNPLGKGIYARPSVRILYGVQYSNQNNAFGNSFTETIDQYNEFGNVEQHLHHVLALETEAWF
jgi:hypothetical protein